MFINIWNILEWFVKYPGPPCAFNNGDICTIERIQGLFFAPKISPDQWIPLRAAVPASEMEKLEGEDDETPTRLAKAKGSGSNGSKPKKDGKDGKAKSAAGGGANAIKLIKTLVEKVDNLETEVKKLQKWSCTGPCMSGVPQKNLCFSFLPFQRQSGCEIHESSRLHEDLSLWRSPLGTFWRSAHMNQNEEKLMQLWLRGIHWSFAKDQASLDFTWYHLTLYLCFRFVFFQWSSVVADRFCRPSKNAIGRPSWLHQSQGQAQQ